MDYNELYKFVLVGDSGVGKSNISSMFIRKEFNVECKSTIGVEFSCTDLLINKSKIRIQLWDTAGQERYRAITTAYYRNALCIILIYDITNRKSFDNLVYWINEIRNHSSTESIIYLVGNKTDLANLRAISFAEGASFATKHDLKFIETSARNDSNVRKLFIDSAQEIYNIHKEKHKIIPEPVLSIPIIAPTPVKHNKCCAS